MDILNWDASSSILPVIRDVTKLSSLVDLNIKETIQCRTLTLDRLLSQEGYSLAQIDLIKIDVQGAELMVFRGGEESLKRTEFILTEVSFSALYEGACVFGQIYSFLCDRGFRLLSLTDSFRGATMNYSNVTQSSAVNAPIEAQLKQAIGMVTNTAIRCL